MASDEAQLNPGASPGGGSSEPWHLAEFSADAAEKQRPPEVAASAAGIHQAEGRISQPKMSVSPALASHEAPTRQRHGNTASPVRAEASRQNGRRSRGPKTSEGKNRSRRNALKHGLRAETLLLEAGNQEENTALLALRDRLEQQFLPRSVEQQLLLETAVHALWQKQRGLQFEARELRQDMVFHGPVMDRILRYGTAADRRFFRSLAELKRLLEDDTDNHSADSQGSHGKGHNET